MSRERRPKADLIADLKESISLKVSMFQETGNQKYIESIDIGLEMLDEILKDEFSTYYTKKP